jgi:hypothetical protein
VRLALGTDDENAVGPADHGPGEEVSNRHRRRVITSRTRTLRSLSTDPGPGVVPAWSAFHGRPHALGERGPLASPGGPAYSPQPAG